MKILFTFNDSSKIFAQYFVLFFLGILACISVIKAFNNAQISSQDFQVWGAIQILNQLNPFLIALENPEAVYSTRHPTHLYPIYFFLMPFGLLSESSAVFWYALFNILLGVLCFTILNRKYKLQTKYALLALFLFLLSTPFRNAIGNGQTSLLILFCFLYNYCFSKNFFLNAIGFSKYSFAPLFGVHQLFAQTKNILLTILIAIISAIVIAYVSNTDIFKTFIGPMVMSRNITLHGVADIFSITDFIFNSERAFSFLSYFVGMLLGIFYLIKMRSMDKAFLIPFLFTASLSFLPHLIYDYVFLLPLLFHLLKGIEYGKINYIYLATIIYFWFFVRILYYLDIGYLFIAMPGFFLVFCSSFLLLRESR